MIKEDSNLIGVKEIARRANVSIATVDRVLHKRGGVAAKTKQRIEEIIKEMDYKPNMLAKRLASKKIYRFAVLIPEESKETEYWKLPLDGIKLALEEEGIFGVEVTYYLFDLDDRNSFTEQGRKILATPIDAVIIAPSFITEAMEFSKTCMEKKIKFVFINSDIPLITPLSYIGPDLYQSGRMAGNIAHYLIKDKGVLVLNISKELDATYHLVKKTEGFESYLREKDSITQIHKLTLNQTDYESVSLELEKFLQYNEVDLIFVTNSRVFVVAEYIKEKGLPIKLIGYDYLESNLKFLEDGEIDFLISQQPVKQGYIAMQTLYNYFITSEDVMKIQHMPIDVLTKENYKYYKL